MESQILFVIELTSPSTRNKDLNEKFDLYYRAGIPVYIISDAPYGGGKKPGGISPYKAGPNGYELLPVNDKGRFWLDVFNVWIGIENNRIACFDADGNHVGNYETIVAEVKAEKARADAEEVRANAEEARANAEKARADAAIARVADEKTRADAAISLAREEKVRVQEMAAMLKAAQERILEIESQQNKPKRRKK